MSDASDLRRLADLLRLAAQTVQILARRQSDAGADLQTATKALHEAVKALDVASQKRELNTILS